MDKSYYWNIERTLTHNALFNFIIGNRGGGKSYGCKEYVLKNFIKKHEQFAYVRRYKDDLTEPMKQFFKDVIKEFPDYEYMIDNMKIYFRKKIDTTGIENKKEISELLKWKESDICGYGFVLSTASNKKSISYPEITTLMFDEFLLDKGNQRYVKNEVNAFLNLYETIARPGTDHKRVICFLLANAITITNPYFLYFDLKIPNKKDRNNKWIWKHPNKSILVEDVKIEKFIDRKRKTEFGTIVSDTAYSEYSIENKFLYDSDTFVEKRSKNSIYFFTFIYKEFTFGVWVDYHIGKMWVSKKVDNGYHYNYSITLDDHKPNTMLLKDRNRCGRFRNFLDNYKVGNVYFEDIQIKNICYEVIKMSLNI